MADRKLTVRIIGDARSLEQAFTRATRSSQTFNAQVGKATSTVVPAMARQAAAVNQVAAAEEKLVRIRSGRAKGIAGLRFAGIGLGAGLGLFAGTQAVRELGSRLETTGAAAFKTEGRIKNMVSALTSGNLVGAFEALNRQPQVLEDLGFAAALGADQIRALEQVASGATTGLHRLGAATFALSSETKKLAAIEDQAGTSSQRLAQEYLAQRDALALAELATDTLNDAVARLGQQFLTQSGAVVTFKGAVDDLNRAGRGEPVFGNIPSTTFGVRVPRPTLPPLSPSQRRELGLIGQQGVDRLPGLRDRERQLNNQLKRGNINQEQRLKILTNIKQTEAEIAAILKDQADDRQRASEAAARDRAAAAREATAARERARREAEAARARAAQAAQDRRNALIRSQFLRLGLDENGDPVTPGVPNLRKRAAQLTKNLSAAGLLTPKLRSQLKRITDVLSDALVPKDVRAKIHDLLTGIAEDFRDHSQTVKTQFRAVDTSKLFTGLGLSPDELRAVRARAAQVGRNGTVPNTGPSAFGIGLAGGGGGMVVVNTTLTLDGDVVGRAVTRHQQKGARRVATQTTGPFAGNGMGFVR